MDDDLLDVLIIGAGVSGIAMGCALMRHCPHKRFAIIERRRRLGGTWDLFRYPGARSDSDMYSYAFSHRPWHSPQLLAGAAEIRDYLAATARESGVDRAIVYGQRVLQAHWSSAEQCWTVNSQAEDGAGTGRTLRARFVVLGTGYYDHDRGYRPEWAGIDTFAGTVVHPQHWPDDLDTRGKHVLVIGSGATAVSLAPALAGDAAGVTVLQRSPSYVLAQPSRDRLAPALDRVLPRAVGRSIARRLNIAAGSLVYKACRRWPRLMRRLLLGHVRSQLRGAGDLRDFSPRYAPWDERLCVVADGDLFRGVRDGRIRMVTDEIDRFDAGGIVLRSGRRLEADIIVTATGLRLQALGGIDIHVDGQPWRAGDHLLYRGVLPEGLPNAAWIVGYINASWTLKAELAATYVCRLLEHLDSHGWAVAVARDEQGCSTDGSVLSALSAGYVRRCAGELPRQGDRAPWRVTHDLRDDRRQLLEQPIDDGIMHFEAARASAVIATPVPSS